MSGRFQPELATIFSETHEAFENNHVFSVKMHEHHVNGLPTRTTSIARLSSLMVSSLSGDTERTIAGIEVHSRRTKTDPTDDETISFTVEEELNGVSCKSGYALRHNCAQYAEEAGTSYSVIKTPLELSSGEVDASRVVEELDEDEDFDDEAIELELFLQAEINSVTDEDIALLGKIATSMLR